MHLCRTKLLLKGTAWFIADAEILLQVLSALNRLGLQTDRVWNEMKTLTSLFIPQGYAAEMDNPLMAHFILPGLQNKKDVLFGNMEEIYHFHNRSGFRFYPERL